MTPAPRTIPLQPYCPNVPVFSGMNGCQFAVLMNIAPDAITSSTTATFTMTNAELTEADSWIPTPSRIVTSTVMIPAGRLNTAIAVPPSASTTDVPGAALNVAGNEIPKSWRKLTMYPDQPTATVAAPRAYSRIRSQPMIQAMNSPRVAYPYVYADPAIGTVDANSA